MLKVIIINRNLYTWPKAMVDWLNQFPVDVHIVDNASTYEPLLEWYKTNPCNIIKLETNQGHMCFYGGEVGKVLERGKHFVISDPDLDLSGVPHDWIDVMHETMEEYKEYNKVGLSLELEDLDLENNVVSGYAKRHESQFWSTPINEKLFKAAVDTTFCLHRADMGHSYAGIRLNRPYTARHLPWYVDPNNVDAEYQFYIDNCNRQISTWARHHIVHKATTTTTTTEKPAEQELEQGKSFVYAPNNIA